MQMDPIVRNYFCIELVCVTLSFKSNFLVTTKYMNIKFFLEMFSDVDFSNDRPPPNVSTVVQATGSIRSPN